MHLYLSVLHNKRPKQIFETFTKENASFQENTSFYMHIQLTNVKLFYKYPDQHFYFRISRKTTDFSKNSSCHKTTIAYFLNSEKWNDSLLSNTLKHSVIKIIYSESTYAKSLLSNTWPFSLLVKHYFT